MGRSGTRRESGRRLSWATGVCSLYVILSAAASPSTETERFWAFAPPRKRPTPAVENSSWPQNTLDFFVLEQIEAAELTPAPRADRRTLIRRASYVLTGLPPSPESALAFIQDEAPQAFERVIDRLLASPAYGERWGRHWLDLARYSDTKGYVYDGEIREFLHAHVYRDWVIRAFNEDMPYDRFLLLQLAADQLEDEDPRSLAAMGFLTLGPRFLNIVHDIIDDRIDVLMRGTQAMTVSCARCHDHKFDPIPTADYYSLYGVFRSSAERAVRLPWELDGAPEADTYEKGLNEKQDALDQLLAASRAERISRLRAQVSPYLGSLVNSAGVAPQEFDQILGEDDLNPHVVERWQRAIDNEQLTVFRAWRAMAQLDDKDFSARSLAVVEQIRGEEGANRVVLDSLGEAPPTSMQDVARCYGRLFTEADARWVSSGKQANGAALTELDDPGWEELRQILYRSDSPVVIPEGDLDSVARFYPAAVRGKLNGLRAKVVRYRIDAATAPPHAVILEDRANLFDPTIFLRGDPDQRGEQVPRRFLAALSGPERRPFEHGSGRLDLAHEIASADNPLTARVMVNRIWQHHFDEGLVRTPSDFGQRGERPTHPELLDALAIEFVNSGWSMKHMHRLILQSATWQQASRNAPAEALDPHNRLLARQRRQRLDFEALRDSLLCAAGNLAQRMGGKAAAIDSTRRTVYTTVDREYLSSEQRVFDFADPAQHCPRRHRTTVPQQALFMMNHPFLLQESRALAARGAAQSPSSDTHQIERLYRLAFQRDPTPDQVEQALQFVRAAAQVDSPVRSPRSDDWRYGYGALDPATGVVTFHPLPHFNGEAWQGGPAWPDPRLGWVQLTSEGGHTGNDLQHAAIRRFVAPATGEFSVRGELRHSFAEGEGVRGHIVSSRRGLLATWVLHQQSAATSFRSIRLQAGDTLDFVVDFRAALGWDTFHWPVQIEESGAAWNSVQDFDGPARVPLTPWEQLAQVLLMSNEFSFVD